jgi:hypothetical protein
MEERRTLLIVRVVCWSTLVVTGHVAIVLVLLVQTLLRLLGGSSRRVRWGGSDWLLLVGGTGVATSSVRVVCLPAARIQVVRLGRLLLLLLLLLLTLTIRVMLRLLAKAERRLVSARAWRLLSLLLRCLGRLVSLRAVEVVLSVVLVLLSQSLVLRLLRLVLGLMLLLQVLVLVLE